MIITSTLKRALKKIIPHKVIIKVRLIIDYIPSKLNNIMCKRKYISLYDTRINNSCIKVGFIVQMPEIWDKQLPLFDALVHNERFHPVLISIPAYDFTNKIVKTNYDDDFFLKKYPEYCIKAYEDDRWLSIRELGLDYIFYQRPYDWYLPKELQSTTISYHTRCCYIPYAFWPFKYDLCGYNRPFFRSLYFGFIESKENCEEIIRLGDYEAMHRYLFCGYPSLDKKDDYSSNDSSNTTTILWTPRWSYDINVGGSHFFEYKDKILNLLNEFEGIELILRPHPLSFQNYVLMGKITEGEVETYKRNVLESGASFDQNRAIDDTFRNTDILITDISSILYTYILYEKPIIFCNTTVPKSPSFESIMECMYMADTWDDVVYWICEIRNGNDELKDKRHRLAEKIRLENRGAIDNIISHLIKGK